MEIAQLLASNVQKKCVFYNITALVIDWALCCGTTGSVSRYIFLSKKGYCDKCEKTFSFARGMRTSFPEPLGARLV